MKDGIRNQLEGLDVERKRLETFMSSDPAWLAYCQQADESPPASIADAQAVEQNLAPDIAGKLRESRLFRAWRNLLAASDSLRELLEPEELEADKPEPDDHASTETETEPAKAKPPNNRQEPPPSGKEAFRTKLVVKSDVSPSPQSTQDETRGPQPPPLPPALGAPKPEAKSETKSETKPETKPGTTSATSEPAPAPTPTNDAPVMQAISALLSHRACATSQLTGQLAAVGAASRTNQDPAETQQPVPVEPCSAGSELAIEADNELGSTPEVSSDVKPDDLSLIRQVGADDVAALNGVGLNSYSEIANLTAAQVGALKKELPEPARISKQQWIEQAAILAAGRQTDHARYKRNLLGDSLVRPPPFESWRAEPLPTPQPPPLENQVPMPQAPLIQVPEHPVDEAPVSVVPAPTEPAPIEPVPIEPVPIEPVPIEPVPIEPVPIEQVPVTQLSAPPVPEPEPEIVEDTLVSTEAALPALDELLVNFAPPALAERAANSEPMPAAAPGEPPVSPVMSNAQGASPQTFEPTHENTLRDEAALRDEQQTNSDEQADLGNEAMPLSARMERFERTMAEVSLPDLRRPQPFEADDRPRRNGHDAVAPIVVPAVTPAVEPVLTPPPLPDVAGTEAKLVDIESEQAETDFDWSNEQVEADWSEADVEIVIVAREPSIDAEDSPQETIEIDHRNGKRPVEEPAEEVSEAEPSPYDLARRMDRLAHYKSEEDEKFVRFNGEIEEASVQIIRAEPEVDAYPETVPEKPNHNLPAHRPQPAPTAVPDRVARSSDQSSRRFLDALTGSRKAR